MWLLLEYEKELQEATVEQLKSQGIDAVAIRREDQLVNIKKESVSLVIVGADWKDATLKQLREDGITANMVYTVTEISPESTKEAKELGCQDIVTYPLPITYLRMWAKQSSDTNTANSTEKELSSIEKIIARKNLGARKRTYTQGVSVENDADVPDMVRGRIITTYGIRGGIGKSTITSLIATHLAERHYSVAVVDLTPKGILLNLHRGQAAITVDDWSKMPAQMDERMVKQSLVKPSYGGFWLLPSGPKTSKLDAIYVKRIVYNIAQYFDFVLVDTVPDFDITDTAVELAHRVIYVAQPDWSSLKQTIDGYEEIKSLKGSELITVAINLVKKREHKFTLRAIEEADITSPSVRIKDDSVLRREVQSAKPMVGSTELREAIYDLVSTFGLDPVLEEAKKKKGIWWFR